MAGRQKRSLHLEKGSWRLEAKTTARILLVLALLGALSWLCLTQSSKVAATNYRIWKKEAEIARLQRENDELLAEIAELVSVSRLESMTLELGYVSVDRVRYVDVPGYSADNASRESLATEPMLDENASIALENPKEELLGISRWWDVVISQFVAWTKAQP